MKNLKSSEEVNSSEHNICRKCEKSFANTKNLQKHLLINKCKKVIIHTCEVCDYSTKRLGDFNKHLNTIKCKKNNREIIRKDNAYKCEQCGKSFRDKFNFDRHLNKKIPCSYASIIQNNTTNSNNTNNTQNNNCVIINAHDPTAFIKNLNDCDKAIYNNLLGAYSINSPESIEHLNKIASEVKYRKPKLINKDDYPSDEEDEIYEANNERLKQENTVYLSEVLCKAFLDPDKTDYVPFFRLPNNKKMKVKYDNGLNDFDMNILLKLIDGFIHDMEILEKEKNISLYSIKRSLHEAYDDFRFDFVKNIKKYRYENKSLK